jgi:hypothetical protein
MALPWVGGFNGFNPEGGCIMFHRHIGLRVTGWPKKKNRVDNFYPLTARPDG